MKFLKSLRRKADRNDRPCTTVRKPAPVLVESLEQRQLMSVSMPSSTQFSFGVEREFHAPAKPVSSVDGADFLAW
jgi:hypothetical protein